MKNQNLIDIIMPNFNKGLYIEKSINSVINQTFKDWHLFIVDDNSTDDSKKILEKFEKKKNISIIYLKKKMGPAFCRNHAIRNSSSKYISFLDSDDFWDNRKLENQIEFMENKKCNFSYTDYVPFKTKGEKDFFKKKIIVPKSFNFFQFIHNTSIGMSSMIVKRSITESINFKNLDVCEDYLFKCEILKKFKLALKCNDAVMYYRISKDSLQSNKLKNIFWVWTINKKFNNLSFFQNLFSILCISFNSIKKYGLK